MCGGPGMDLKVASTIGFERHHNQMLAIEDEQEFIDASVSKLGAQPPNFKAIVALNHGPLLTDDVELARLFPHELQQRQRRGRARRRHTHRPAVRRGPRAGRDLDPVAARRLRNQAGLGCGRRRADHLRGQRRARGTPRRQAGGRGRTCRRRSVTVACSQVAGPAGAPRDGRWSSSRASPSTRSGPIWTTGAQVLDVREHAEFEAGHIPESLNVPWHDIDGVPAGLDPERQVLVICASGQRAGTAASLLQRLGVARRRARGRRRRAQVGHARGLADGRPARIGRVKLHVLSDLHLEHSAFAVPEVDADVHGARGRHRARARRHRVDAPPPRRASDRRTWPATTSSTATICRG